MKTFALFPTICVFILAFGTLKHVGGFELKRNLLWSLLTSLFFAGLVIGVLSISKSESFAYLLVMSNGVFALTLIPVMTFLINGFFSVPAEKIPWIRLFVVGFVSSVITAALFEASLFFALVNNPMDPAP